MPMTSAPPSIARSASSSRSSPRCRTIALDAARARLGGEVEALGLAAARLQVDDQRRLSRRRRRRGFDVDGGPRAARSGRRARTARSARRSPPSTNDAAPVGRQHDDQPGRREHRDDRSGQRPAPRRVSANQTAMSVTSSSAIAASDLADVAVQLNEQDHDRDDRRGERDQRGEHGGTRTARSADAHDGPDRPRRRARGVPRPPRAPHGQRSRHVRNHGRDCRGPMVRAGGLGSRAWERSSCCR